MTIREAYEYSLIEINKVEAPSILLDDFVYLFNKAIQQKVNEIYNRYDTNQQSTDDLNVLQTNIQLSDILYTDEISSKKVGFVLPDNYFHILNCISTFVPNLESNCYNTNNKIIKGCKKLTSDIHPQIITNSYMKPSYKNPYFYIIYKTADVKDSESSHVIEIHFGIKDKYDIDNISVTYLRKPKYVTLSHDEIDNETDETEKLEFPDYICYEIVNTFIKLLLDNASDPRLQTTVPINQSIAAPGVQNQ